MISKYCYHVIAFCEKDESGAWKVEGIQAENTPLLEIELLDAIIDACKKDKKRYPTNEIREAFMAKWEKEDEQKEMDRQRLEREQRAANGKKEKPKDCHIYFIKDQIRGYFKIGQSKNYKTRFDTLKTANPCIELVLACSGIFEDEKWFHNYFTQSGKHIGGEWFELDSEDMNFVLSILEKHNRKIIYQKAA